MFSHLRIILCKYFPILISPLHLYNSVPSCQLQSHSYSVTYCTQVLVFTLSFLNALIVYVWRHLERHMLGI